MAAFLKSKWLAFRLWLGVKSAAEEAKLKAELEALLAKIKAKL